MERPPSTPPPSLASPCSSNASLDTDLAVLPPAYDSVAHAASSETKLIPSACSGIRPGCRTGIWLEWNLWYCFNHGGQTTANGTMNSASWNPFPKLPVNYGAEDRTNGAETLFGMVAAMDWTEPAILDLFVLGDEKVAAADGQSSGVLVDVAN